MELHARPNADGAWVVTLHGDLDLAAVPGFRSATQEALRDGWNELVIECKDGKARCSCNGEVFEEAFKVPETGPIGLEGDRGQIEYRRIRIKQ